MWALLLLDVRLLLVQAAELPQALASISGDTTVNTQRQYHALPSLFWGLSVTVKGRCGAEFWPCDLRFFRQKCGVRRHLGAGEPSAQMPLGTETVLLQGRMGQFFKQAFMQEQFWLLCFLS